MSGDESHHELVDQERWFAPRAWETFDRIGFAQRALAWLGHARLTVLFYRTGYHLRVRQGRDLARGNDARWAFVGIPPSASREEIVLKLADLVGSPGTPWLIQLVIAGARAEPD